MGCDVKNDWCRILEVYLEYTDELDVLHNDYPLAPEKLAILYEMLSDYFLKMQTNME